MGSGNTSSGIILCEEAFERLQKGKPRVAEHVGLDSSKITAGIVSVEAGFDRGYLKKARVSHQQLIAKIEAFRRESRLRPSSRQAVVGRALIKAERAKRDLGSVQDKLYQVVAQNLQLVERIRALEQELSALRHTATPTRFRDRQ